MTYQAMCASFQWVLAENGTVQPEAQRFFLLHNCKEEEQSGFRFGGSCMQIDSLWCPLRFPLQDQRHQCPAAVRLTRGIFCSIIHPLLHVVINCVFNVKQSKMLNISCCAVTVTLQSDRKTYPPFFCIYTCTAFAEARCFSHTTPCKKEVSLGSFFVASQHTGEAPCLRTQQQFAAHFLSHPLFFLNIAKYFFFFYAWIFMLYLIELSLNERVYTK